jgi:ribulose-bisphosphate carboxylase large chain
MSASEVVATYLVESYLPLAEAAEVIAGEQSTGTFVAVARETDELRARFAARVLDI